MKSCKKEALIKTLRDVGIWSAVGAVVIAIIILILWAIDIGIRWFATQFPLASKTIEFGVVCVILGVMVLFVITMIYASLKTQYNNHLDHCKWVRFKKGN